jgi:hypothetical protein
MTIIREPVTLIKTPEGTPEYFHFAAGSTLNLSPDLFAITHDGRTLGRRVGDRPATFKGKLAGEFENITTLFPHLSANLGSRLIGDSDVAWRLITPSGRQWDFHRGAITTRPGLMPMLGESLLGEITLTAVYSVTEGGWWTYSEGNSHPGYSSLSLSAILTAIPALSFGSSPFDDLAAVNGAEFEFAWELAPVTNGGRLVDYTISSQTHTAKLEAQNDATFAQWMTKIGGDATPGSALPVADLIASYSGFYAALKNAECELGEFRFSTSENFVSGLTATAMQRYSTGTAQPLAIISTSAP